jgi:hypothetical protein
MSDIKTRPATPREQALNALSVIALDVDIAGHLLKHDPQALRQVNEAIRRLQHTTDRGFDAPVVEFAVDVQYEDEADDPRSQAAEATHLPAPARANSVTCRFCGVSGFAWSKTANDKWALVDLNNVRHNCRVR